MDKEYYIVSDIKQNGIKNDNFKIIPINKIIFDKGMHILAKEKCDDICKNTGANIFGIYPVYNAYFSYNNITEDLSIISKK